MNKDCENRFRQLYLININKINILMIAEVVEINAPLNRIYQSLSRKKLYNPLLSFILGTVINKPFLASEHRERDPPVSRPPFYSVQRPPFLAQIDARLYNLTLLCDQVLCRVLWSI